MAVHRFTIEIATNGNGEVVDLHPELARRLDELAESTAALKRGPGLLSLLVVGSTAALTTIEFEVGLVSTTCRVCFND